MAREETHVLNRPVIFTELPGSARLPEGTILNVKFADTGNEHDVTAVTPTGQQFVFKSVHIVSLIKSPFVSAPGGKKAEAPAPVIPAKKPEPVLGDVQDLNEKSSLQGLNESGGEIDVTGTDSDLAKIEAVLEPAKTEEPAKEEAKEEKIEEPAAPVKEAPVKEAPVKEAPVKEAKKPRR